MKWIIDFCPCEQDQSWDSFSFSKNLVLVFRWHTVVSLAYIPTASMTLSWDLHLVPRPWIIFMLAYFSTLNDFSVWKVGWAGCLIWEPVNPHIPWGGWGAGFIVPCFAETDCEIDCPWIYFRPFRPVNNYSAYSPVFLEKVEAREAIALFSTLWEEF